MKRSKRIYILLGVLAAVCLATFAAVKLEQRQEQIKNSDEVILSVAAADVQSLRWNYGETSLAFTRDENAVWHWDEDEAFPVSEDKMNGLLELFASFGVSFIIEEVEDYSQYGLDDPICTIELTTAEQTYTLELGDFSKLDSKRYVSIGDGNVYLVSADPMDKYELTIRDLIDHDEALDYDAVTKIQFSGAQNYTISHEGDKNGKSICADDVFFADILPLDTDWVESYLDTVSAVGLTSYVSYNATEEELENYGLNDPELTIVIDCATVREDDEEVMESSYILHVSRSAEQRAMTQEEEDELTSWVAYVRVGESQILYQITSAKYESLMKAAYNDLRHREVFTADFGQVTSMDISLEGNSYTLTAGEGEEEDETVWLYGEDEVEIDDIQSALEDLEADSFTDETATGQQEIKLTLHLDNESFPKLEIILYRYDGTHCLAAVDGKIISLIPRSDVVDLVEAVNAIVLN